ncbi:MAG: hypothetical protein WAX12_14415 [Candidatus Microthrix subdominans]|jgi:hypothetical protein|uniref:Uncharacterized protein n=1 Tax=Candidatus Neomicrothrix subdominans TaxID=2954438 RepID=A0A936NEF9_9ACTN|nr:hypothetical protein [Candidatus Microthrix sp.]MBK9297379.1 hypothetical protein [Candidatus Microthrix subdominans]MBK6309382.1 hypothetical protein [Candidatus Microthrix sp.]MBK6970197.1 hypothetical protein [Candidatus Microthrix sp.]MBK7166672.1 hypothetical protein [Candidatus Microthrix sp.]MBK9561234.1 hypothetical protein [Candidatus Microthrix sp.]
MPVEQRSTSNQFRTAGIALLMVGAGLALVLVLFGQGGSGEPATVSLGTDEFALGPAAERAQVIAKTGPFLLPDVSGRGQDRPIMVSHEGPEPEVGWAIFEARAPGAPDGCYLRWDRDAQVFVSENPDEGSVSEDSSGERCDDATFPMNGAGLKQLPWEVSDDGILFVKLGDDSGDEATTTTAP